MLTMQRTLASTAVALLLLTGPAQATESANPDALYESPAEQRAIALNRDLAKQANTLAAEDAIAAVLQANRLALDIRLNGHHSEKTSTQPLQGR